MNIRRCTRQDFLEILDDNAAFWGSDRALGLHHPMLIEEFGDTAFVAHDGDTICGYLFGFFAQTGAYFYIHLVGVRDGYKRRGVGQALYAKAETVAKARGATALKAITTLTNSASLAFHAAQGFQQTGAAARDEIRYEPDYARGGHGMVVMRKRLT